MDILWRVSIVKADKLRKLAFFPGIALNESARIAPLLIVPWPHSRFSDDLNDVRTSLVVLATVPCLSAMRSPNDGYGKGTVLRTCVLEELYLLTVATLKKARHTSLLPGEFSMTEGMNTPPDRPAWFLLTHHWLSLAGVALVPPKQGHCRTH